MAFMAENISSVATTLLKTIIANVYIKASNVYYLLKERRSVNIFFWPKSKMDN